MFDGLAEEPNADSEEKLVDDKVEDASEERPSTTNNCTDVAEPSGATTPIRHPNQLAHGDVHTQLELSPIFDTQQRNSAAMMGCIEKNVDNWPNPHESAREWSGFASDEFSGDHSGEISFGFGEASPIKTIEK